MSAKRLPQRRHWIEKGEAFGVNTRHSNGQFQGVWLRSINERRLKRAVQTLRRFRKTQVALGFRRAREGGNRLTGVAPFREKIEAAAILPCMPTEDLRRLGRDEVIKLEAGLVEQPLEDPTQS